MSGNLLLSSLNQIAVFLKVSPGKLSLDANLVAIRIHDNKTCRGYANVIREYLQTSKSPLAGETPTEKAEILQWIEYALIHLLPNNNSHNHLKELNEILSVRTYFVAEKMTIVDTIYYYLLHNTMESLSYLNKERFVHLSRWFDNLQQNSSLRQKNKIVNFDTNFLVAISPARH